MNEFNPGDGWRKVDASDPAMAVYTLAEYGPDGEVVAAWVRAEPLPTEPGYYVDAEGSAWRLDDDGEWDDTFGNPLDSGTGGQPESPLVRYEPRAVTAKAVIDRVRALTAPAELRVGMIPVLVQVADEFGAGS